MTPERFWATISRTEEYRNWWPWLRRFDADDLVEGAKWVAVIQSPLPYALHVDVTFDKVIAEERLEARVTGDIAGQAWLVLSPSDAGSAIDVGWKMRPRSRAMQVAALVARPLLRLSHEWVLARGLEQFRRTALVEERRERDQ